MKFKLDENLGSRSAQLFTAADYDVATVLEEKLSGASDDVIYRTCIQENRCLISLDLDFADVLRLPPHESAGIAILRLPKGASLGVLEKFISDLLTCSESSRSQDGFGLSKRAAFEYTRRPNRT